MGEQCLKSTSAHCRSFQRRVFPVNYLNRYWQPIQNNQKKPKHGKTQK